MTTIGLLYDTHVTYGTRKAGDGQAQMDAAIDKINEQAPDWTVHGGDIRPLSPMTSPNEVDWGGWDGDDDNVFYHKDFNEAKTRLENRLNSEYRVCRGNHDRPYHVLQDYFPSDRHSPNAESAEDGDPAGYYGSEIVNGVRYVYLDSNGTMGYSAQDQIEAWVSANQLSMLDRLADDDSNIPTFVFLHNPLVQHGNDYNYKSGKAYNYELIYNRTSVRSRLEKMNTQLVHSGHVFSQQDADSTTVNGIEYTIGDHLYRYGSTPGDVRWLTVDESAKSATLSYYDFETGTKSDLTTVSW